MSSAPDGGSTLVLVTGQPCSGKSTLAEGAAAVLGAPVLGWDWAMAGLTWCAPVQAAVEDLQPEDHRRVGWSVLANLAEAQLRQRRSVILDGVARDEVVGRVRRLAKQYAARSVVILTTCADRRVLRRRVEQRRRTIPGWYELTWDHVGSYRWQPPTDVHHTVDTSDAPDPYALASVLLAPSRE